MGTFTYAQNVYHAWSQVHAEESKIIVKSRGVDAVTREIIDLYSITIEI
jgi:hypothetical protein